MAVGSSQLPWAHSKLAANLGSVKGLVGLDSGGVSSRGARSPSDPPILRLDTVAPSVAQRHVGGGKGEPADSIGGRPTARRNAGTRAGATGVAAPTAAVRPKPRQPTPPVMSRARARRRGARVRRRGATGIFSAAIVRGAKSISHPQSGAPVSGFVARPAAKPCGESSSESGGGGSGRARPAASTDRPLPRAVSWLTRIPIGPRLRKDEIAPRRRRGREGSSTMPGTPLPFSDSLERFTHALRTVRPSETSQGCPSRSRASGHHPRCCKGLLWSALRPDGDTL